MSEQSRKVVLITGGSDGLGKAIAKELAPNHEVIISSANGQKAEAIAHELGVEYVVADVRQLAQSEQAVAKILENHGRLDCLINSAGLWIEGELDGNEPERIQEVVDVNLTGLMYATKAVIPQMKQQGSGLIVNVCSQAGINHKALRSVYNATKWGVTGFTKSLADDLGQYGIGVTGLYPGKMKTKLFEKAGNIKKLDDAIETEEVARLVSFLLSAPEKVYYPEVGVRHVLG